MGTTTNVRSHPTCWAGDHYEHTCQKPSQWVCGCGKPAGTRWGPYFCPDCDVDRLDRIAASLDAISASFTPAPTKAGEPR